MALLIPAAAWVGGLHSGPPAEGSEGKLDTERTRAVAAMLGEKPRGFGAPIGERAMWNDLAEKPAFQDVVRKAEECLRTPLPESSDNLYLDFSRTGNRTRWQDVNGRRTARAKWFVLAECLENEGRFLTPFEETVAALCAERTWVMPAHDRDLANFEGKRVDIDLRSATLAWELATADYLLGEKIAPETRHLIRENLRRRALDPFRDMATGKRAENWWIKTTNNWNAVCLAGVTGTALTLVESREERAFYIVAAERYVGNFLAGFAADGYCSEGVAYWNYGFGNFLLLAETIHQATGGGLDLLKDESARAPAAYGARIEIVDGVCPAFADCSVDARPGPQMGWYISRRFGLGLREHETREVATPDGGLPGLLMYSFPNSASRAPLAKTRFQTGELRTWFSDAGVLICRPGKDGKARLGVAMKGGHNGEHHNHNDVGSFVVVVGGRPVLADPGNEVYTARTFSSRRYESKALNSFGHPVPLVAGRLQRTGEDARGEVIRADFTAEADTLALNLRSAYEVEELEELKRTFVYSRSGAGSFKVTDEALFAKPSRFGAALITFGEWEQDGEDALTIRDGNGAVRVEVRSEGAGFTIQAEEIQEDFSAGKNPVRLGLDLNRPVTSASITLTIQPLSDG